MASIWLAVMPLPFTEIAGADDAAAAITPPSAGQSGIAA
jgi:hypothetical protein